ncbi:hypothetical protein SLS55_008255 [Diplodia seriata]|uniref:Histidine kinase hhk6p n=1 Tax=Diplodia seriata TaxID=420778 RepID=A0ABR3C9X1_9PEZI
MRRSAPPLHLAAGASNGQPIRDAAEPQYAAQKTQMPLPVNDLSEPASYFDLHDRDPPSPGSARSEQLSIIMPPTPTTTAMALATLQYLPVPVLVLSSLKTVVLANEAMGRLLEVDRPAGDEKDRDDVHTVTDTLHGQTMLDLGIEMLQDGSPIRISWEVRRLYRDFLDSVWKQAQGEAEGNVGGPSEMVDESDQTSQMKDAILDSIAMPAYAMWKDENFGIPNRAMLRFLPNEGADAPLDQREFLESFKAYTEDFKRQLEVDEFPVVQVCRTKEPVLQRRVGMIIPDTGEKKVYEIVGEPIRDDRSGEFLGAIVVFKDVTEYTKRIAEQIEENEKQFEYITNLIPIMVWTTKPNGDHDWFSKRWYDYTGLTEEESLGKGWKLPFHEDDMPETSKRWQHSLKTGEEYNTEYRCRRYDGQWRWMLGRAVPFRDDLGKVIKWFGTCTDIHELVELRETAKQMRAQLLRVLEHARVTLWAVNRDRKIVLLEGSLLNDSFSHVTREKIGTDMYDLFSRDEAGRKTISELEGSVDRILDGKDSTEVVEMQFDGNNRWYRTRIAPLMVTSRQAGIEKESYIDGVYGVSMDITELRKRREELQAREEENSKLIANAVAAKEASRMKSQFLANMSHEIRTPIAGVIGMSELLLDTKLDQEQKDCAENIQRSANGLLTVINDILDLSKVESGRLDVEEVQFSLLVVLRDVNKMMAFAALRKNISYESNIPPEIERDLKVMGDPGRLRQILTNLLTNSIKFTSEGHVSLSVSINSENDETINVHFVVEDTGIGIEEEVRQRLFKPFSQADSSTARRFGGTGLGLAISKNLVDLMHGNIDLQSTLGQGTRASFSIPFNKAQYQDEGSPLIDLASIPDRLQSDISVSCGSSEDYGTPPLTPVVPNSGKSPLRHGRAQSIVSLPGNETERKNVHVLVVEDNQVNQQIALKTIRKQGFAVDAVWNGKEALEYLVDAKDGKRDRPDIILMDVQMPIMDGYKATHTIRTQAPFKDTPSIRNIPIVAMTASAIQGDKEKCQKAGMDDYLSKPVRGKLLEKMLVKWAVQAKRKQETWDSAQGRNSTVPETIQESGDDSKGSKTPSPGSPTPPSESTDDTEGDKRNSLTPALDRISYRENSAMHKTDESESERAVRRAQQEEKAADLRDEKLLSSTDDPHTRPKPTSKPTERDPERRGEASHALTRENMEKLVEAQEDGLRRRKSVDTDCGHLGHAGGGAVGGARKAQGTGKEAGGSKGVDGASSRPKGVDKTLHRSSSAKTVTAKSMSIQVDRGSEASEVNEEPRELLEK